MKTLAIGMALIGSVFFSCSTNHQETRKEKAKKEIRETEMEFAQLCKKEGVEVAFSTYAADNAVIHRDNKLLKGKGEIQAFYKKRSEKGGSLDWTPDFVDVSESCDVGYTYGHYVFISKDSIGNTQEIKGIFHTVWKKQKNGVWRFVWD